MEVCVMARTQIKNSVRFEVFKRDSFTCQYCGQKAPDVVLEVDHITPIAAGGGNSILNLVTACRSCNSGKSDRKLTDSSALTKARRQADDMNERRKQIEMIAEWHASLLDIDTEAVSRLEKLWLQSVMSEHGTYLLDNAKDELRLVMKRYGFEIACQGIVQAAKRYMNKPDSCDQDAARNEAFWSISKICAVLKADRNDPGIARLFYIRGILRNRLNYMHEGACISLLKEARAAGISVEWLEQLSKAVSTWTEFRKSVECYMDDITSDCEDDNDGSCS
jgi:hypothetical protein